MIGTLRQNQDDLTELFKLNLSLGQCTHAFDQQNKIIGEIHKMSSLFLLVLMVKNVCLQKKVESRNVPFVIHLYNESIVGVDRAYQLCSSYSTDN